MVWMMGLLTVALVFGSLGTSSDGAVAQDATKTPTAKATKTPELEIEDAVATIEALQTEVAQLKKRVTALSGSSGSGGGGRTPTAEAEEAKTYEIGETIELQDQYEITVTGVELAPSITTDFASATARGVYVLVYMTIVNQGSEPGAFPWDDTVIIDESGRSYGYDYEPASALLIRDQGISVYEELQPGLSYDLIASYDVPADATGLKFAASNKRSYAGDLPPFMVDLDI